MRKFAALSVLLLLLGGCGRNMVNQAKFETYEASPLFRDGGSSRPLPEDTLSREEGSVSAEVYAGTSTAGPLTGLPVKLTPELLARGQQRYNIYCSPCHNYSGDGKGIVVQRGLVGPRSFYDSAVISQPPSYFFTAMTNGFGQRMFSYAARIPYEDRWAIAAYVKALQFSRFAPVEALPAELQQQVKDAHKAAIDAKVKEAEDAAKAARAAADEAAVAVDKILKGGTQ